MVVVLSGGEDSLKYISRVNRDVLNLPVSLLLQVDRIDVNCRDVLGRKVQIEAGTTSSRQKFSLAALKFPCRFDWLPAFGALARGT